MNPGSYSSIQQEILGFRGFFPGYSQYRMYCTRCENTYAVYKGGDESITYIDSIVPVKPPYLSLEGQRLKAEADAKAEAEAKAANRKMWEYTARAKADADAKAEAEFTAKVQAEVAKMLAKLGVKNGR